MRLVLLPLALLGLLAAIGLASLAVQLGRHMGVARCLFSEIDTTLKLAHVVHDWTADTSRAGVAGSSAEGSAAGITSRHHVRSSWSTWVTTSSPASRQILPISERARSRAGSPMSAIRTSLMLSAAIA